MAKKINWKQNQPIIRYLREVFPEKFPALKLPGHGVHASGIGGYNNRNIKGSSKKSDHSEGRAADIFFSANKPTEKKIADMIFVMFVSWNKELGVDYVIWNNQIWSRTTGGPRLYKGNSPHTNHLHVSFTKLGSQSRPEKLVELLEDIVEERDWAGDL